MEWYKIDLQLVYTPLDLRTRLEVQWAQSWDPFQPQMLICSIFTLQTFMNMDI